ncbi:hypothetical protein MC7420_7481 [Coleofasciculus chthonoplastes PCC 7420]|uniref:Uncharacterized protein n=1 Tax=Coleofasciculus chthonoplastes PCC 7420 TaxID=118168 RepID=B4VGX2_9CYAN|nr:hypothetical protein MC7420_7481 [Coleofasciculus chthonoplastes PCC 7420]
MQQAKSSKARYSKGFIFENCHNLNRIAILAYREIRYNLDSARHYLQ